MTRTKIIATTRLLTVILTLAVLSQLPEGLFALSSPSPSSQHGSSSTSASQSLNHPRPSHPFQNKIVACGSTNELARAVALCVQPHHKVAELGSQLRDVSTKICQSCASAVLVDVKRKLPKNTNDNNNMNAKQPHRTAAMRLQTKEDDKSFFPDKAKFLEIPKLQDWREAFFFSSNQNDDDSQPYDVLVLDVNAIVGNDLEWTSLSLIQEFQSQNRNDHLIVLVKSVGLNQFASRLVYGKRYTRDYKAIPPPHILATVGVQEYRNTIPHVVLPQDAILEVGCHFGTSTVLLDQAGAYCIGVDVGSKIIKQAKAKYPEVYFDVGDAWKTASLLRIQQDFQHHLDSKEPMQRKIGYDVVYVDVGGLSGADGLLEAILLVTSIQNALEPRCIVIKSLCMQRLSTTLVSFWELQKRMKQIQEKTG